MSSSKQNTKIRPPKNVHPKYLVPSQKANGKEQESQKWVFSFQNWDQRQFFGLSNVPKNWFVALLKALRDLSSKDREDVMSDATIKKGYRIHSIDWDCCSIKKETFHSYLPKEFRVEETDILQFQVEKSKGRVIGYLDDRSVFQIVLLDPDHNMQLSSHRGRKPITVKTEILPDSYESMATKLATIVAKAGSLKIEDMPDFIMEVRKILKDDGYASKYKFITVESTLLMTLMKSS